MLTASCGALLLGSVSLFHEHVAATIPHPRGLFPAASPHCAATIIHGQSNPVSADVKLLLSPGGRGHEAAGASIALDTTCSRSGGRQAADKVGITCHPSGGSYDRGAAAGCGALNASAGNCYGQRVSGGWWRWCERPSKARSQTQK